MGGIVGVLRVSQPLASKHLRVLRDVQLVNVLNERRTRLYSLNAAGLGPIHAWVGTFEVQTLRPNPVGKTEASSGTADREIVLGRESTSMAARPRKRPCISMSRSPWSRSERVRSPPPMPCTVVRRAGSSTWTWDS